MMNSDSQLQKYDTLTDHEKWTLRRQLAMRGSPVRKAALTWLNEQYQEYRQGGGELVALAWALRVLPADVWNCLFAARMSSYSCPTVLLANEGGRYRAVYKK